MKLATCLLTALVLLCTTAVFADVTTKNRIHVSDLEALKSGSVSGINNPVPNQGGEDIGTAVPIPALPYSDAGNTCTNIDDYDEVCPFTGSTAPDVVYSYTPGADTELDISLCNSGYDTKLFVYENAWTPGVPYACNDDACGSDGFRSELTCVPMTAGNTYYIVVDGYFGACGDYSLSISECTPCTAECPPGSQIEGEPVCFDDYKDAYNGGCNATPNVFSSIACDGSGSNTMCGEYGGFFHSPSGFNYRDTDWYELDPTASNGASVTASGVYESLFGYLNAGLGCGAPVFEDFLVVGPCDPANFVLGASSYWFFAGTSGFGAESGACGGDYTITIDNYNCEPVSVEEASWGSIKNKYSQR